MGHLSMPHPQITKGLIMVRKKLQKKTKAAMAKVREEDTIRMRKKVEELFKHSQEDQIIILKTIKQVKNQLNNLREQEIKNSGALAILQILLKDEK